MARPRAPHGTKAALRRHHLDSTRVCDACQAFKDKVDLDVAPASKPKAPTATYEPTPRDDKKPTTRKLDPLRETLDNLSLIEDAMVRTAEDNPDRLGPLSKRRSELITEAIGYGADVEELAVKDPLEQSLETGADLTNVTRIA
jgi:hypothetical protein